MNIDPLTVEKKKLKILICCIYHKKRLSLSFASYISLNRTHKMSSETVSAPSESTPVAPTPATQQTVEQTVDQAVVEVATQVDALTLDSTSTLDNKSAYTYKLTTSDTTPVTDDLQNADHVVDKVNNLAETKHDDASNEPSAPSVSVSASDSVTLLKVHTGSSVLHNPFFVADTHDGIVVERQPLPAEHASGDSAPDDTKSSVLDILDAKMIGPAVKAIYRDITDPDHGITVDEWNFLSASEIKKRQDVYKGKFLDIATRYHGMGWVIVLAYIPETNNFFFRSDGGSSGWDREANFEAYSKDTYIPAKFPVFQAPAGADAQGKDGSVQKCVDLENKEVQYTYRDAMRQISETWVF